MALLQVDAHVAAATCHDSIAWEQFGHEITTVTEPATGATNGANGITVKSELTALGVGWRWRLQARSK